MDPNRYAEALNSYLRETFADPYVIGKSDCLLFVAGWVDRAGGSSLVDEVAGSYDTYFRGLHKWAPTGVQEALRVKLLAMGWQPVATGVRYQPGDVILTDLSGPGIWRGRSIVCKPTGAAGQMHLHIRHAKGGLRWQ
jgi:hypothetical protein